MSTPDGSNSHGTTYGRIYGHTNKEAYRAAKRAERQRLNHVHGAVQTEAERAGFIDPAGTCLEADFSTITTDESGAVDLAEIRYRLAELTEDRPDLTDGRALDPTHWKRPDGQPHKPDMHNPYAALNAKDMDAMFYGKPAT